MTCICIFKAYVENTQTSFIQIMKAIKLLNTFNMTYYNTILTKQEAAAFYLVRLHPALDNQVLQGYLFQCYLRFSRKVMFAFKYDYKSKK